MRTITKSRTCTTPFFLAMIVCWFLGATTANAQAPVNILSLPVTVTNGTAGSVAPSGLTVVLHQHKDANHEDMKTITDLNGQVVFNEIMYNPETIYWVSVDYRGSVYSKDLDLSAHPITPVFITVHESVTDESILSVYSSSVLIAAADTASRTLWTLEIVNIHNNSDKTYVPNSNPMSLIRFGLPPGATNLNVDTLLSNTEVIQVDRGFALNTTLPPGNHEVMYTYRFPYTGAEVILERSFPYGADTLRVLVQPEVANISSQQLLEREVIMIGSQNYQVMTASNIKRDAQIAFELHSIPQPSLGDLLGQLRNWPLEYLGPLTLIILMTSLIVATVVKRGISVRMPPEKQGGQNSMEKKRNHIIRQIANLEIQFEKGTLDETQYNQQKSSLSAKLVWISRQRG